jgi:mycothiol synthase
MGEAFQWRAITTADAGAIATVFGAAEEAEGGRDHPTEQDMLDELGDPYLDLPRGSIGAFDGSAMAGWGALAARTDADPVHDMRLYSAVHPAYRGQGIGTRLLVWAEQTAPLLHRERYPDRPLSLTVTSKTPDAAALYTARGYRPVRDFYEMIRDLAQPLPGLTVPDGVDLEQYSAERSADALLVRNEAFRDHWGSTERTKDEWANFTGAASFRPEFSIVAYCDGEPAGILLSQEREYLGARELYIALVGTRRQARKRGIGRAMLTQAITAGKAVGFGLASLGVDADSLTNAVRLYESVGFRIERTATAYRKELDT